jgi:uncharacterized protein (DUF58 family)
MLTTKEILKKVRILEIKSKRLATDLFTGEYHSAFKGRGMSFKEVREYAAGDDIRFIDWNVSARFGHPFSKVFEEERELTVMLLIDVSASTLFGTLCGSKKDIMTEIGAVVAFSAVYNGDKVGAIFYSDKIEKYIPPKKGKQHALYLIRELLTVTAADKQTNLKQALQFFNSTTRQNSIAFIMSDFIDGGYEQTLRVAGNRHDIIGLKIYDKMEQVLPNIGLVRMEDEETGEEKWIDTSSKRVRQEYEKEFFGLTDHCIAAFKKAGSDLLHVRTDDDYVKILRRFFISRNR